MSFHSSMTITALTALCLVEQLHLLKLCLLVTGYHHLCDTLSGIHNKILVRKIDKHHPYLTTIVGINGSRSIENCNALFKCEPTSWSYLRLISGRQGDM